MGSQRVRHNWITSTSQRQSVAETSQFAPLPHLWLLVLKGKITCILSECHKDVEAGSHPHTWAPRCLNHIYACLTLWFRKRSATGGALASAHVPSVLLTLTHPHTLFHRDWGNKTTLPIVAVQRHMETSCVVRASWATACFCFLCGCTGGCTWGGDVFWAVWLSAWG